MRRAAKLAGLAALLIAALPLLAALRFRHVPYEIPAELRAPTAGAPGGATLRWLGIAGYALEAEGKVLLVDPVVTRPTALGLLRGPLKPDEALLARRLPRADYILIKHAHYDHAVDAPALALRTGAVIVGTPSALNLARARGVPAARLIEARVGERLRLGPFTVDVRSYSHGPILGRADAMTGVIPADAGRLWFWQYRQDGTRAYRVEFPGGAVWFAGADTFAREDSALPAGTVVVEAAGLPLTPERLSALLARARPERVLPSHYDNFLQPLEKGLALLPGLRLAPAYEALRRLSPATGFYLLEPGESIPL